MKVVGVLSNYFLPTRNGAPSVFGAYYVNKEYYDIFSDFDVLAISIPYELNSQKLEKFVSLIDGLVLTGGFDIPSHFFNEKVHQGPNYTLDEPRVLYEHKLLEIACKTSIPILGICMGMQVYNVFKGGSLYQDLYTQIPQTIDHSTSKADGRVKSHLVDVYEDTRLHKLLNKASFEVNSSHHQSVKQLGDGLKVSAVSKDGVIEAIEGLENQFLGIQWHPESLDDDSSRLIFESFVSTL
ncbi:MAG: gamma-glutamyl-gamma-aminobutyrate hydrolase family protein [Candidatus Cloacimonetes bacterium]|nr:gamma-glutamyl-gamma-aminobutyrate hydrolase family protein [Candidatus Cloacimonadota bacterium]